MPLHISTLILPLPLLQDEDRVGTAEILKLLQKVDVLSELLSQKIQFVSVIMMLATVAAQEEKQVFAPQDNVASTV